MRKTPPLLRRVPLEGSAREWGGEKNLQAVRALVDKVVRSWEGTCAHDPVLDKDELEDYLLATVAVHLKENGEVLGENSVRLLARDFIRRCGYHGDNTGGGKLDKQGRWEKKNWLHPTWPNAGRIDIFNIPEDAPVGDDDLDWNLTDEEQADSLVVKRLSRNDSSWQAYSPEEEALSEAFWESVRTDPPLSMRLDHLASGYRFAQCAQLWGLKNKQAAWRYARGPLKERLVSVQGGLAIRFLVKLVDSRGIECEEEKRLYLPGCADRKGKLTARRRKNSDRKRV